MEMLTVKVENNSGLDYRLRFLAAHFESKCCMPGLTIQWHVSMCYFSQISFVDSTIKKLGIVSFHGTIFCQIDYGIDS